MSFDIKKCIKDEDGNPLCQTENGYPGKIVHIIKTPNVKFPYVVLVKRDFGFISYQCSAEGEAFGSFKDYNIKNFSVKDLEGIASLHLNKYLSF